MSLRNWVVSTNTELNDPLIFGPYSERRARQIAMAINRHAARRTADEQENDWLHATAYPLRNPGPRDAVRAIFP